VILALAAAAAAAPDCDKLAGAIARDECELAQSLAMSPAPNCSDRETQLELNVCSFRDYLRADIELNRTWTAVTKKVSGQPAAFALLRDGQRAWLTYRDKQCAVWGKWYEGGTIAPLMINSCLTDITRFRTKELGQFLEDN
jgi:uncharacterized protein YecT (DUF1311 family)